MRTLLISHLYVLQDAVEFRNYCIIYVHSRLILNFSLLCAISTNMSSELCDREFMHV